MLNHLCLSKRVRKKFVIFSNGFKDVNKTIDNVKIIETSTLHQ